MKTAFVAMVLGLAAGISAQSCGNYGDGQYFCLEAEPGNHYYIYQCAAGNTHEIADCGNELCQYQNGSPYCV